MSTPVSFTYTTGQTLYAFPDGVSLATWSTNRVALTEGSSPNTGRYSASLDEDTATLWRVFSGASQPASWDLAIAFFLLGNPVAAVSTVYTPGSTLYAYPDNESLADWTTNRVALTEQSSPNTGRYTATLSAVTAQVWRVFVGASQPASWDLSIEVFDLSDLATIANTCRVTLLAIQNGVGVQARVYVTTSTTGRQDTNAFAKVAFDGETDESGLITIDLPWSSIDGVGAYRFKIIDLSTGSTPGAILHDRTVTVPDEVSADYGDLEDA